MMVLYKSIASFYKWVILLTILNKGNVKALVTERVQMDIPGNCPARGTTTKFVKDNKAYLLQAKSGIDDPSTQHCEVILGPYNENRSLNVTFLSFYILDSACGASITIFQGRSSSMLEEKQLMKLDCTTHRKPRELSFVADKDLFLKFAVVHNLEHRKYNFNINVIAGPSKVVDKGGLTIGVQIGIIVISIVIVFLIGYLIYKIVRLKMSMRDLSEEENITTLNNLSSSNHSHLNSYVPMPSNEQMQQLTRREPDPEIYFEYNPSQSHLIDKDSTEANNISASPPEYDEALNMPLSVTPGQQYDIEYVNVNR